MLHGACLRVNVCVVVEASEGKSASKSAEVGIIGPVKVYSAVRSFLLDALASRGIRESTSLTAITSTPPLIN